MKKVIFRALVVFTFLLALVAVFGGVDTASAHAATLPTTHTALSVTPNINSTYCAGRSDLLQIYTSTSGEWCYANSGYTPVTIPNVYAVCGGNNNGYIVTSNYGYDRFGNGCIGFYNYGVTIIAIDIY